MNERGFTALELSIVLSIGVVLIPIIHSFGLHTEDQWTLGSWYLDAADGVRTVAEELALDAARGVPSTDGVGFQIGECAVRYVVNDESKLIRQASEACGGVRGLSAFVESVSWSPGGLDIVFARRLREDRVHRRAVFLPVEGR